ncbi:hypothetical protein FQN60_011469 [Etheostoma spectabile]|uniref:Uncharacterized protein n=1 Tax=Etheostoma spectabile TaxID=54343 RepID=A0A5J5C8K9_9PERO|nr:hypothetical protein FQN60_011469 [Etheostoma spectabile]
MLSGKDRPLLSGDPVLLLHAVLIRSNTTSLLDRVGTRTTEPVPWIREIIEPVTWTTETIGPVLWTRESTGPVCWIRETTGPVR